MGVQGPIILTFSVTPGAVPTGNNFGLLETGANAVDGRVWYRKSDGAYVEFAMRSWVTAGFQPLDATLTALAGVTTAADKLIYATGADAFATADLSSFGRTIVAGADAAAVRTSLLLGSVATLNLDTDITLSADSNSLVASQQAVKRYVDNALFGLFWKQAVRVATTANGTLATAYENGDTVDGVVLATGDRILLKNQTTATENGIYIVAASGAPTRSNDANTGAELVGATVFVTAGTANGDTQWTCTNDAITIGSTSVVFAQVSGAGTYSAGSMLGLSGNQFSVTNANLLALGGLTGAADTGFYFTAVGTMSTFALTSAARTVLDDTTVSAMVDTLGGASSSGTGGLLRTNTPTITTPVLTGLPTGTGVASAATASTLAARDSNGNLTAVAVNPGYTTTVTAAGTTTLTVGSNQSQYFTGTTTQNCVMPVASTLVVGQGFRLVNRSTGVVTVNSSGGNLIVAMVPGSEVIVICTTASGTTASSWDVMYGGIGSVTGTGASVLANGGTLVAPLLGTPASINLANATGQKESFVVACSDESTAIVAGTGKVSFRMPYAATLTAVRASCTTAPTGSTIIIDINESGTTILSTKLSIDATEKTSTTAASAAVISDASLADDAEITIDFDQVGSTIAGAGVKVTLFWTR